MEKTVETHLDDLKNLCFDFESAQVVVSGFLRFYSNDENFVVRGKKHVSRWLIIPLVLKVYWCMCLEVVAYFLHKIIPKSWSDLFNAWSALTIIMLALIMG